MKTFRNLIHVTKMHSELISKRRLQCILQKLERLREVLQSQGWKWLGLSLPCDVAPCLERAIPPRKVKEEWLSESPKHNASWTKSRPFQLLHFAVTAGWSEECCYKVERALPAGYPFLPRSTNGHPTVSLPPLQGHLFKHRDLSPQAALTSSAPSFS